jgi:hypothetical protein
MGGPIEAARKPHAVVVVTGVDGEELTDLGEAKLTSVEREQALDRIDHLESGAFIE